MTLEIFVYGHKTKKIAFSLRAGSPRDWDWGWVAPVPRRACSQAKLPCDYLLP